MAFSSSTVSIGDSTKQTDYQRLLDNTQYNKTQTTLASKGKADITIDEYDTTAAPDVKSGSVFDNNGVIIEITSDATPTGYSGISNSTTFYLYWDEDPGAFIYSETAPSWSDALQGWYNSNDRALFSMFKDSGGTLYQSKNLLQTPIAVEFSGGIQTDNIILKTKVIPIGDWDMNADNIVSVNHGVTDYKKIRDISIVIRSDVDTDSRYMVSKYGLVTDPLRMGGYDSTVIAIYRLNGGFFDNVNFDSTSYNRGWITITYEA